MNDTLTAPSTTSSTTAAPAAPAPETAAAAKPAYNTHLSFYHANGKNTGAAIQFSLDPATPDRDGSVFFSIAKQKTVATTEGERRPASFDWANKITVKLNFIEVAEILLVLGGHAAALTHAGKEGLFHNSPSATTNINFKRSEDPARPGFLLGVGRTPKADPNARQYVAFAFWPAEAFGLRIALTAQMGLLAFGTPRSRTSLASTFGMAPADPLAAPAPATGFAAGGDFGSDF